jgi:D-alanyl-lipoteichoic acid acyltransferase DltB (MBOAT superfamily)
MLPLSPAFFAFAGIAIALIWASNRWPMGRLVVLLAANFFFLARFAWFYPVILLAAASSDFLIGLGLQAISRERRRPRLALVSLSLFINIGLLAASKTLPLALGDLDRWIFPLSLSFYCFQSLTYTIDLFRGTREGTRNYLAHLSATTLFTVIVAGPINRVSDLIQQLRRPFALDRAAAARAMLLIASGLMKKMLIADYLGDNVVNRIFDTPTLYSGAEVLIGVYAYALQIYYDFSGYTDIAMGVSLLLGLTVPDNFNRPYRSVSIIDFWRRWHITFSNWLRDYAYFSLPSARKWEGYSYFNPIIVMLVGGLWHGIGWTFLVWGLLHGVALTGARGFQAVRNKFLGRPKPSAVWRWLSIFLTFQFVCLTWIYFRAPDIGTATAVLQRIGSGTWTVENISRPMLWVMLAGVLAHLIPPRWFEKTIQVFVSAPAALQALVQGVALAAAVLLIEILSGKGAVSFVYGNF